MKQASLISLGCAKNLVDSERMVAQLVAMGFEMTPVPSEAELIVINTCGFLESAVQEAINTILEAAEYKVSGNCTKLVVAGCMVQRYGRKLLEQLPEVDLFLGTSHYHELGAILQSTFSGTPCRLWIGRPVPTDEAALKRVRSTPPHTAYVKIAEGCGNSCSFCIIPHLRGPLRSRAEADILAEVASLGREGVREINLIAQDTTAFGLDRKEPHAFVRLLEGLDKIPGIEWIRILYAYPDRISEPLLRTMAQAAKIVPYLDIPFQHCVSRILAAMGRPPEDPQHIIDKIRFLVPGITLRTSLIVGFPGETPADYKALLRFMERAEFDHTGVFTYSPETGTRAARFPKRTGEKLAEQRRAQLLEVQREISRRKLQAKIDCVLPVLIEGRHPETDLLLAGRLSTQAPEVDGGVIITAGTAEAGTIRKVQITATHEYDLEGMILEE